MFQATYVDSVLGLFRNNILIDCIYSPGFPSWSGNFANLIYEYLSLVHFILLCWSVSAALQCAILLRSVAGSKLAAVDEILRLHSLHRPRLLLIIEIYISASFLSFLLVKQSAYFDAVVVQKRIPVSLLILLPECLMERNIPVCSITVWT